MIGKNLIRGIAGAVLALAAAAAGKAGIVATYQLPAPGLTMTIELGENGAGRIQSRSGRARVQTDDLYGLTLPDGRNLRVWDAGGGRWMVADQLDIAAVERERAARPQEERPSPWATLRYSRDGEEQVGRWTGTRYALTYAGPTDDEFPTHLVLLERPDLAPLGRFIWASYVNTLPAVAGQRPVAPSHAANFGEALSRGAPLRLGNHLTLIGIEVRPVDPARLVPPAPVMSRDEYRRYSTRPLLAPVAR